MSSAAGFGGCPVLDAFQGRGSWFDFSCPKDCSAGTDKDNCTSSRAVVTGACHCSARSAPGIFLSIFWVRCATSTVLRWLGTLSCRSMYTCLSANRSRERLRLLCKFSNRESLAVILIIHHRGSGNSGSTISMFGVRKRKLRSCSTCT